MKTRPASKNLLKSRKKLLQSKYRKKEKLFIAEGIRCVEQVLANGKIEVAEFFTEEGFTPGEEILNAGKPVYRLAADDFRSLTDTETPQGVVAVCRTPEAASGERLPAAGLFVAFDALQDPGNLGTMIRTASWFGASGLIFGEGCAEPFHPKVVRSTAGATGALPYLRGDLERIFADFEREGWQIFLLDGSEGAEELEDARPAPKSVLTVGNEGGGIAVERFTKERKAVRIEGAPGHVESLNAAVALGIGLYRFLKK